MRNNNPPDLQTIKTIRLNYHFMLKSDGTGNFTQTDDGMGNTSYNGYIFAEDMTKWMNNACAQQPENESSCWKQYAY
jgi:hypothetical protein